MVSKVLTQEDIHLEYSGIVTTQDYSKKTVIEGVRLINLNNFSGEDGYFMEIGRIGQNGELLAYLDFKPAQISYSLLLPNGIKGCQLHYKQEDIWFVPPDHSILFGLHDLRKDSPTNGKTMRIVLGNHRSQLLVIPRGVAHGYRNLTLKNITLLYLTNEHFNLEDPDEHRLPWDYLGADFWEIKKG